jgi:hypothetical protein
VDDRRNITSQHLEVQQKILAKTEENPEILPRYIEAAAQIWLFLKFRPDRNGYLAFNQIPEFLNKHRQEGLAIDTAQHLFKLIED